MRCREKGHCKTNCILGILIFLSLLVSFIFFVIIYKNIYSKSYTHTQHANTDSLSLLRPGPDGGPCGVCGRSFPMAACGLHNGNLWATLFVFIYGQVIKICVLDHRLWIRPYCPSPWCNSHSLESNVAYCLEQRVSTLEYKEWICWIKL